ncbi:MAG: nicotinate (nicotinamide) nucleotide adenylyltransferase [Rikenellaceae bacterium]|nr:nicotinate (nicotinamide) nucleotide adenylyltransferase [Rikenellaceae bacterium]MCL2692460.1 nicotinate (nicotinamide) nucleotide adenylyltransferase [Rikenellaceae bacterium]
MIKNIILYFGSFNPPHNGHTAVARYVLEAGLCDELWFVVSPHNPLKNDAELACGADRLRMTEIAVSERLAGLRVSVCDVEFNLPTPSYTIDTLEYLRKEFPQYTFSVLAGADVFEDFGRWKEHRKLLNDYKIYVYPRTGHALGEYGAAVTFLPDAPTFDYSSTDVRHRLLDGDDVSGMISPGVLSYITDNKLWPPMADFYLERARLHDRNGRMDKALNDYLRAQELDPQNTEAAERIAMLREIFAYRYFDYYNP